MRLCVFFCFGDWGKTQSLAEFGLHILFAVSVVASGYLISFSGTLKTRTCSPDKGDCKSFNDPSRKAFFAFTQELGYSSRESFDHERRSTYTIWARGSQQRVFASAPSSLQTIGLSDWLYAPLGVLKVRVAGPSLRGKKCNGRL